MKCIQYATKKAPAYYTHQRSNFLVALTHTDISGPINPLTLTVQRYVAVFVDNYTKSSSVYFRTEKVELKKALLAYCALVEN